MKERLERFWESVTRFFLGLYSKAIRKPKMSEARRKRRAAYKTKYTRAKTNGIAAFWEKAKAFGQKTGRFFVEVNAKLKMKWERFMNRHKKMSWLTYARAVSLMAAIVVLVFTPVAIFAGAQEDKEQKTQQDEARVLAQAEEKKASEKLSVTGVEVVDSEPSVEPSPEPTPEPTPEPKVKEPLAEGMENAELVPEVQARLMALDYMDHDQTTNLYGPMTANAVECFQRKHGIEKTGILTQEVYDLLMSENAQPYSVGLGDDGEDVGRLQERLIQLGYLGKSTGYYGEETEVAVKDFQASNGLNASGKIGHQTKEKLYSEDVVVKAMNYGERSDEVKAIQERLATLGYMAAEDSTGYYGDKTLAAVKRFQERNGLIADGAIGPETKNRILSSDAQANAWILGTSGDEVQRIQDRLIELKYMKKSTGYFGSDTEKAVKAFQERNGLTADGKVGAQTSAVLFSSDAKKAASTSTSKPSTDTSKPSSGNSSKPSKPSKPAGDEATGSADSAGVERFIAVAEQQLGKRYVLGGKGPDVFDCSGFVFYCLNQAGVNQGYMTSATWQGCTKYPIISNMNDLQRGDVISFKGHVGIYLGGGRMIDASSTQGKIRICENIQSSSYWTSHFVKGLRIF